MTRAVVLVALALSCRPAWAGDITVEDGPMQAPIPPEVPGGAKPVLRECKVTTTRTAGPAGAEVEHTRRICRWAVPSAEP